MAAEIRFDCRFCNNSVYAPRDMGGKRVKCPHCKNPIAVPAQEASQAKKAQPIKKTIKKDPGRRPVHSRPRLGAGSVFKILLLSILVFGGYKGWQYYQKFQQNPKTLLQKYDKGDESCEELLLIKIAKGDIGKKDVSTFSSFARSEQIETRILVAKCLGKIANSAGIQTLKKLLKDKESPVRTASAHSLSNIETKESVKILIKHLKIEQDDDVKNTVYNSLFQITGVEKVDGRKTDEFWVNIWWKEHKNDTFAGDH